MKGYRWDTKYLYWGVTAFLVIAACSLFFLLVSNLGVIRSVLQTVGSILSPFVWGLVIAYLLFPLMGIYSRCLFQPLCSRILRRNPKKEELVPKLARGLSVAACILTLLLMLAGLISLVLPQVIASIQRIERSYDTEFSCFERSSLP